MTEGGKAMFRSSYDVVICGGGLAGATLARQLILSDDSLSVLMLDKLHYPVPLAAHKVGESSVEIAGHYFAHVLQLHDHMKAHHLPKHGLRYFWNGAEQNFAKRPELGLKEFTPCPSFQIDRGKLENELFALNTQAGVTIAQSAIVEEIDLSQDQRPHHVLFRDSQGEQHQVGARWVIDAMGRRLYLQKKLGLHREVPEKFNAAWMRVRGRIDVCDFVPEAEDHWHSRVPENRRYLSTTHLMGQGYWIWLIPLGSGNTSVGIVTDEQFHDPERFKDLEHTLAWISEHDPVMSANLDSQDFMDFMSVRNFNYSTNQVFSEKRWACVGEAAAFSDPFYSPGSNMIGFENSIVTHLVGEDRKGRLSAGDIQFFNEFVISQNDWLDYNIHTAYAYFGDPLVMSMAFLWDAVVGWGVATPQMFNDIYLNKDSREQVREALATFYPLAVQVKQLLIDWGKLSQGRFTFEFIDYYHVPFVNALYAENLKIGKSSAELRADHHRTMMVLEDFAQVIFRLAVEDALPSEVGRIEGKPWLNAWKMSLDPSRWEADGLFRPTTSPRDIGPITDQIRALYRPVDMPRPERPKEMVIELDL